MTQIYGKIFSTFNLTVIGEAVLEKQKFENNAIHMLVYGPGTETDNLLGSKLLYKYDVCQFCHLL